MIIKITKIDEFRPMPQNNKTRVAAYCMVSTDSDEQQISLDTQCSHYERYIKSNFEWDFARVYFDEGVTGTKKEIRKVLMSLISDCEKGLVDYILTKSISRFCRNITDCLDGKSTHLIAKELNKRGITSKKGVKWSPGSVLAIIRNEKYTGDVIF